MIEKKPAPNRRNIRLDQIPPQSPTPFGLALFTDFDSRSQPRLRRGLKHVKNLWSFFFALQVAHEPEVFGAMLGLLGFKFK